MTEKELAARLVRNAAATQARRPDDFTEANSDPEVKGSGNAAVANSLEFLGKHAVVIDVQPTLGKGGMGFAFRIRPELVHELGNDDAITHRINLLFEGAVSETSSTLADLLNKAQRVAINSVYREDLLASLNELKTCFGADCYIACLALSGKILEICLKQVMIDSGLEFDDGWMIGRLLGKLKESRGNKYLDQSLPDIANVINKSRIPAVHAKENIPVPSREQAVMVIHAVVDTVNRVIVSP